MVNGTASLHLALLAAGVRPGDEVIAQALTFVATANAIKHANAEPVFVDVERDTLGMSPEGLRAYLGKHADSRGGRIVDVSTGRAIAAVVPMHTFGHPARIGEIEGVCSSFGIPMVEDAAEALGSLVGGRHVGRHGIAAILSFNGNKPVTTGGGGMVITDDDVFADRIRSLSTTAKRKHPWEFFHDEVGYNLRLPNVNAAIGCAQMEYYPSTLENKRKTAADYLDYFSSIGVPMVTERHGCRANFWLNAVILADRAERDSFLAYTNGAGVQTRPIWTLMTKLPPYQKCAHTELPESEWLENRVVNVPSSVRLR